MSGYTTGKGDHWCREVRDAGGNHIAWCGRIPEGAEDARRIVKALNEVDALRDEIADLAHPEFGEMGRLQEEIHNLKKEVERLRANDTLQKEHIVALLEKAHVDIDGIVKRVAERQREACVQAVENLIERRWPDAGDRPSSPPAAVLDALTRVSATPLVVWSKGLREEPKSEGFDPPGSEHTAGDALGLRRKP